VQASFVIRALTRRPCSRDAVPRASRSRERAIAQDDIRSANWACPRTVPKPERPEMTPRRGRVIATNAYTAVAPNFCHGFATTQRKAVPRAGTRRHRTAPPPAVKTSLIASAFAASPRHANEFRDCRSEISNPAGDARKYYKTGGLREERFRFATPLPRRERNRWGIGEINPLGGAACTRWAAVEYRAAQKSRSVHALVLLD
jgi:hypothetical protein